MQVPSQSHPKTATGANTANVTSAIGMQETAGSVRARRNTLFTQTVIWVTALICVAFLLGSLAQAWSNSQLARQVQQAQQQLQSVQAHHDALAQMAGYYSDPAVIENEARQQLGYVRPGEHPIVIVNPAQQPTQAVAQHTTSPVQHGFWQNWWNTFFGDPAYTSSNGK